VLVFDEIVMATNVKFDPGQAYSKSIPDTLLRLDRNLPLTHCKQHQHSMKLGCCL